MLYQPILAGTLGPYSQTVHRYHTSWHTGAMLSNRCHPILGAILDPYSLTVPILSNSCHSILASYTIYRTQPILANIIGLYSLAFSISHWSRTRWGGRMSRVPGSLAGRSRNPKIMGSSPNPADSISGRVKPMTLKLIFVAS